MNRIDKIKYDFEQWYETSSVGKFLQWWSAGLKSFVPKKYQDKLFPKPVNIYLVPVGEEINVWQDANGEVEKYVSDNTEEQWWHQVQHIATQSEGRKIRVQYLIPGEQALVRKIALPQAAKDNLDDVLGFELDKYVPFNSEQVQISYKIDKGNTADAKILMDLAVIPKQKVGDILEVCEDKSVSLDSVDINLSEDHSSPDILGVNLLPVEKRKPVNYFNLKLNSVLMLLLVGLIYFIMHTSIVTKQDKIDKLTEINSKLQKNARTSKLLRKDLKNAIVSSKFLQNKKKEMSSTVAMLSEITSIFPEHTYITRFRINDDKLEIVGQSSNANSLIPKMDESALFYNPQLVSTTPDPRTGKEKFTIKADLKEPQPEDENGVNS